MKLVTEELTGGITRIALEGRLDIEGAAFADFQVNAIADNRNRVLLDLQNVSYIGSRGLHTLVKPARTIQERGGKVVFFAPSEMVEKVLKVSKVDAFFPIHHDLQSAINVLR